MLGEEDLGGSTYIDNAKENIPVVADGISCSVHPFTFRTGLGCCLALFHVQTKGNL